MTCCKTGPYVGATGRLKLLQLFLSEKNLEFGLRFNNGVPSFLDTQVSRPGASPVKFRLLSLPCYLVCQSRRLCAEAMEQGNQGSVPGRPKVLWILGVACNFSFELRLNQSSVIFEP